MNRNDRSWNPWHGCRKCSEGCQNCYMFFLDSKWDRDGSQIHKNKTDVTFSLLTKRAYRIKECLPHDWGDGWDNVYLAVSCENQKRADERIPILLDIPTKHK